jgi:hypothetical protein
MTNKLLWEACLSIRNLCAQYEQTPEGNPVPQFGPILRLDVQLVVVFKNVRSLFEVGVGLYAGFEEHAELYRRSLVGTSIQGRLPTDIQRKYVYTVIN